MSALQPTVDNIDDLYDLTPVQQAMLVRALMSAHAGAYVEQSAFTIDGSLDAQCWRQAWEHVVGQTPVLRTSFHWQDLSQPVQLVHRSVELPWCSLDWSDCAEDERARRLDELLADDRARGFSLDEAPLLRCILIRCADRRHEFVWTRHHLVLDRWSRGVLLDDVNRAYDALRSGRQPESSNRMPFRRYVAWLNELDPEPAREYWRGALSGSAGPTGLPLQAAAATPPAPAARPSAVTIELGECASRSLRDWASAARVTLGSVVQGAWALTLARLLGVGDVVFGITVSGRPAELAGASDAIGMFINALPVRLQVAADQRIGDWLNRVQDEARAARAHSHLAGHDIRAVAGIAGGGALFRSLLVVENVSAAAAAAAGGLAIGNHRGVASGAGAEFTLTFEPDASMRLSALYDGSRWSAESVAYAVDVMAQALRRMPASGELSVAQVLEALPPPRAAGGVERKAEVPGVPPSVRAPRDLLVLRLGRLWERLLDVDAVEPSTRFDDAGGGSLAVLQLLEEVQRSFGLKFPLSTFIADPTIEGMARWLRESGGEPDLPEGVAMLQGGGSQQPLFIVPGGGGGALELFFVYDALVKGLGPGLPVYGLVASGSDGHGAQHGDVAQIAADFVRSIESVQPRGPVYLVGDCGGGILAFETGRLLVGRGRRVALLALLDVQDPGAAVYWRFWMRSMARFLRFYLRAGTAMFNRLRHHAVQFARLRTGRRDYFRDKSRAARRLARDHGTVARMKHVRQRHRASVVRYRPEVFPGRITLIVTSDPGRADPVQGWSRLARDGAEVHRLEVDHRAYQRDAAAVTARVLRECVETARRMQR